MIDGFLGDRNLFTGHYLCIAKNKLLIGESNEFELPLWVGIARPR